MVRQNPASRSQVQKQYLELLVLAAKGRKEKLQATPEFKALLAALEQQCYARVLMDEERPGSPAQKLKAKAENPTEEEVRAYFTSHSERYATPEKFTARHILVSLKGASGGKGLSEEEAKARIARVQEELKAGKNLEDLAKDYSDDPGSKDKGGLYTDIPYGRFAKEFEEAVRRQDIGQVGDPIKTAFGYHLIQVLARQPRQAGEFEKVKDSVRQQMIPERQAKLKQEFLEQAKKEVGYQEGQGGPGQP
jgi:parvulin-like peptidyl-prolyl isomerase